MAIEYHPIMVHFPIALAFAAMVFDVGRWIFARERLLSAGFWGGTTPILLLAFGGSLAAITTGLIAEPADPAPVVHELIEAHETLAFIACGLLATLSFWRIALRGQFPSKAGFLYLALLLALTIVLGYGAYFGGQMVYSHGVGVKTVL